MSTITPSHGATAVIARQTVAAAGSVRGAADLRGKTGKMLALRIVNNAALTAQCVATIRVATTTGDTPAASSASTSPWFELAVVGGGTISGLQTDNVYELPDGAAHVEVACSGHTGGSIDVEASVSYIDHYTAS